MVSPTDFLKSVACFEGLGDAEIERISRSLQKFSFARGEVIFLEGEPCRGLYVVKTGNVRVFKTSPEGREQVLFIAKAGDGFNDVPVFDGGPNPASALALETSVIYLVPKEVMFALVADCPAALAIIRLFARRLRHLTDMVEDLSFRTVVGRLAKLLLALAVAEGDQSVKRLTQEEMAAMVGSVRDVINRALRHLKRTGAIKIEGQRIQVVDPEKLRKMT